MGQRSRHKLTNLQIKHLSDGVHNDGGGLYLRIRGDRRSWLFRFAIAGRKREMGLGSLADVTLAQARQLADEARRLVASGVDPVEARKRPVAGAAALTGTYSFRHACDDFLAQHEAGWRNSKHRQQWRNTLDTYAGPLMAMPVGVVGIDEVESVLLPIWQTKAETASRLRARIERVLDYAIAKRHRRGPNPATWRGNLEHVLPKQKRAVQHMPAIAVTDAPAAFQTLWARRGTGLGTAALCLLVLGAMRSGEVRGLDWSMVEVDHIVLPPTLTKTGRTHRIPLTDMMRDVMGQRGEGLIFHRRLSENTLAKAQRLTGIGGVPHGWRSTFSDWANGQGYRRDHIEDALGHVVGSAVERAYRRGDFLEQRREIMTAWCRFLAG